MRGWFQFVALRRNEILKPSCAPAECANARSSLHHFLRKQQDFCTWYMHWAERSQNISPKMYALNIKKQDSLHTVRLLGMTKTTCSHLCLCWAPETRIEGAGRIRLDFQFAAVVLGATHQKNRTTRSDSRLQGGVVGSPAQHVQGTCLLHTC